MAVDAGLLARAFPQPPAALALAVSGGGDSLALLHLALEWGRAPLHIVTVDHGLRKGSRDEAEVVASLCHRIGLPHEILTWTGWDGASNLQDAARRARFDLISDWARGQGIAHVALGHTADDQAETFLMRLSREAGLDGLAAMRARFDRGGVTWHRPLLTARREALRDYLRGLGQRWAEDPSNDDARFERARARKVLSGLKPLGIEAATIAASARNLAAARTAMAQVTTAAADRLARFEAGDVVFDRTGLLAEPPEIARRLVTAALRLVASSEYPPRAQPLALALQAVRAGRAATLLGAMLLPEGDRLRICREPNAVANLETETDALWDNRWRLSGPKPDPEARIRALGETGLAQCKDWRETGLSRQSLLASPAIWAKDRLIAAPVAGFSADWCAELAQDARLSLVNLISD